MAHGKDTPLNRAIAKKGFKIGEFAEKYLQIQYKTFKHQLDNKTIRQRDITKILKLLDVKYEDVFL